MKHVFISYHHDDTDFAEVLINKIKKAGFETWVDNDQLHPGIEWQAEIDQAIKNSFVLIVIMTPEAKASEYVTYEWAAAFGAGVTVIPILYKNTKLHPRLERLQYLKFTTPSSRFWNVLIKAIKNAMANTPTSPMSPNSESSTQSVRSDTIKYPPPLPEDEEVEILFKEIVYEYAADSKTMWQRKRIQMQVRRNGLTHVIDRYSWTGSGKCVVRSLTPGFYIINQRKEEIWDYFNVNFPYPFRRGEVVDFTIEWELFDEAKIAIPFLSTMIDHETRHLLLRVVLPPELAPKRAYCYEFANYIDTLPVAVQETHWDPATQSISYDVPQPKKYHKYLIRWFSE